MVRERRAHVGYTGRKEEELSVLLGHVKVVCTIILYKSRQLLLRLDTSYFMYTSICLNTKKISYPPPFELLQTAGAAPT